MENISEDTAKNLPSIAAMRYNIQKAREDVNIPQIRLNVRDIHVLQNKYKLTISGEPFALVDNAERYPERMFIFISEISCVFLSESEHWFYDETFRVCPEVFF